MKEAIRAFALGCGADVCGFADAGRFDGAPAGFRPRDILASSRTMVVIGVAMPRGTAAVRPEIVYNHANALAQAEADRLAFRLAAELERTCGRTAVPLPGDTPYEYWNAPRKEGRGILSMKHAAVLAGIGTLGKSTLLLSRRFGTRLNLSAVLTDVVSKRIRRRSRSASRAAGSAWTAARRVRSTGRPRTRSAAVNTPTPPLLAGFPSCGATCAARSVRWRPARTEKPSAGNASDDAGISSRRSSLF